MPKREYTEKGFKLTYKNDIIEIYKIVNNHILVNNYTVSDKKKLFKNLFDYIYKHSDTKLLNV